MSSRSGVRGRRTRVYDCNYNMGESYYKPTIDRLDRKTTGGATESINPQATGLRQLEERYSAAFANDDLDSARRRAEKTIAEDTLFDSRGGRAARGRPLSSALEEAEHEFDDEITASLRRIRANKKMSSFIDDVDMENSVGRSRLGLSDKILDTAGVNESRRAMKIVSSSVSAKEDREGLTRWTALSDEHGAAARANQTRARLSDLEDESAAMQQRQMARERRAADLRALIADF